MKGYIKIGKPTKGHLANLQKLGYDAHEADDHYVVEVSEFVTELDLTQDAKATLAELIQGRKAITYATRAQVLGQGEDGEEIKTLFSFALARKLGTLSCLMMKPKKGSTKKQADSLFDLDDFVS